VVFVNPCPTRHSGIRERVRFPPPPFCKYLTRQRLRESQKPPVSKCIALCRPKWACTGTIWHFARPCYHCLAKPPRPHSRDDSRSRGRCLAPHWRCVSSTNRASGVRLRSMRGYAMRQVDQRRYTSSSLSGQELSGYRGSIDFGRLRELGTICQVLDLLDWQHTAKHGAQLRPVPSTAPKVLKAEAFQLASRSRCTNALQHAAARRAISSTWLPRPRVNRSTMRRSTYACDLIRPKQEAESGYLGSGVR